MATPATKKTTAKTRPVYYANVAFYIPRKGVMVNTFTMDEDYASMVNRILGRVFDYTGEEGFQDFDVKVKTTATGKTTLTVTHPSWKPKTFKAEVVNGQSGLQALFDQCLHKTVFEGNTMHEFMMDDRYLNQQGFVVREGMVDLPAKTPLYYMSTAYQSSETDTLDMAVFMNTDYVALMQEWVNHLGAFGETKFTITQGTSKLAYEGWDLGHKGDLEYQLTVEHPSWEAPKTVRTVTGHAHGSYRDLLDVCMDTVVKTDADGPWRLEDVLEDQWGISQSSMEHYRGTFPLMPKNKASKKNPPPEAPRPSVDTPNTAILPDLKLSPDLLASIEAQGWTPGQLRHIIENHYASKPWGGVVMVYVRKFILDNFKFSIMLDDENPEPEKVAFLAREVDGLRGVDVATGTATFDKRVVLPYGHVATLLHSFVKADFDACIAKFKDEGYGRGFVEYVWDLHEANMKAFRAVVAKMKKATPSKAKKSK